MPLASLLFTNTFDGAGSPTFDPWPNFTSPMGNPALASQPVVDGHGWGIASRHHAALWRLKETRQPGRGDYKADLHTKWKNPGGQGDRSVGLIVRFKDFSNFIIARLASKIGGANELTLWKVIGGVESQLGSTYTGTGVSGSKLYAGMSWRVRVEDLQDGSGDTSIKVFTDPLGASGDGDLRIDWIGPPPLRGNYTVGVELGELVKGTDVRVDNLEVYDFGDEWTSATPSEAGAGWQVELDGVLYDCNDDTGQLEDLALPVTLMGCGQALGLSGGQEAKFRISGEFQEGTFLRANQEVRVYHDGDLRFNGYMSKGRMLAQPQETQEWTAKDSSWRATYVNLEEDDCSGTLFFNVYDQDSDDRDPDRQGMTIGEIIAFFFDRYVDSNEGLRFYGAAPAAGLPYVQSELNLLDAVVPDISVSGNFLNAIQTLLKWMPTYQIWVDPEDKVWHFRDVTSATGENIALASEWAKLSIQPDPERSATAILWRGAKKEQDAGLTLSNSDAAWTDGQAQTFEKNKRHKSHVTLDILFAADAPFPPSVPGQPGYQGKAGQSLVYVEVAPGVLDDDDFRGAVASVSGDAYDRWVVSHTSTRLWLSSPAWGGGTPPTPPQTITLNLVHPDAVAALSSQGVGRAFFLPLAELCPGSNPYKGNFKNGGWCGSASVSARGDDKSTSTQNYRYKLHMMSVEQTNAFGRCGVVELAEKPKPPIGLFNKLPPPGGSPPVPDCQAGGSIIPQVQIEINLPTTEECAPKFRIPEEEETFEGDAYEEWGVRRTVVIDDPDFVHVDQEPGLKKAAQNTLDVFSQKIYLWDVTLATPWRDSGVTPGFRPPPTTTSRWAGLTKRITLSSSKRTTGYESIDNLPVFSVWWDVPGNTTTLRAGTAAGWIGGDFGAIARTLVDKNEQKRIAKMLKELEDFRNRLIAKAADRVGGTQGGAIDGCDVQVIDQNTKKVTNINVKAEQEQELLNHQGLAALAADTLFNGVEQTFPGAQPDVPGLTDTEAQQALDGPVLRSYANHRIPFMGPTGATNSDRGKYGGLIGIDSFDAGGAPEIIFKRGGLAFRKKPNATGDQGGGVGLQYSQLGTDGHPTSWTDYSSPLDLPTGMTPLSMLGHGSTQHQLLLRSRELARALGRVENSLGELLAPGDSDAASGIDEAPADLASMFRASGLLGGDLRIVPASFGDPGGLVFEGPVSDSGATSGMYWRVMTPEMLLVRVSEVPGAGTNGGDWEWFAASGDSYQYMTGGGIVHKQAHPAEFEPMCGLGGVPHPASGADATHPFGITGNVMALDTSARSGVAVNIPIPPGAVGTPVFSVGLKEDWDNPMGSGAVYDMEFAYSYQASAWTASSATTINGAISGNVGGTGTGQFRSPGGAVPPGLRAVSAAVNNPGTGSAGFGGIVTGISVDIAVIEGGYLARIKEDPIGVADEVVHSHPATVETVSMGDSFALEFTKVIAETVGIGDDWSVELNPPVDVGELVTIGDSWSTELNP